MKSNLLLKILVAVIFVLAIVGMVMVASAGEATPEETSAASFVVDLALVLLVATTILSVVASLISVFKNPAALKKTLLGLAIFGALFLVSYLFAGDEAVFGANGEDLLEAGSTSKWSGTGLIFSYILLAIGGVFFVVDLLKSLIKS